MYIMKDSISILLVMIILFLGINSCSSKEKKPDEYAIEYLQKKVSNIDHIISCEYTTSDMFGFTEHNVYIYYKIKDNIKEAWVRLIKLEKGYFITHFQPE